MRRQLWSIGGFVSAILDSLFGKEQTLKTLWFSPKIPVNLRNTFFAGSSEIAMNELSFKGKKIDVKVILPEKNDKNSGFYVLKALKLNGIAKSGPFGAEELAAKNKIEIELQLLDKAGDLNLIDCSVKDRCFAPLPVDVPLDPYGVTLVDGRLQVAFATLFSGVTYNIYRDGKRVASGVVSSPWRDENSGDYAIRSYCYSVSAVNSEGWESHHSDPLCYWGENYTRTSMRFDASAFDQTPNAGDHGRQHFADWGKPGEQLSVSDIVPEDNGTYILTLEYGSGRHYKAVIRDAFNMSYFDHFTLYTAGIGGGSDVYNRANISTLKLFLKEIKSE